ncbi:hypothetical protein BV25DRAFT_1284197 [Artomyces pyxidatus]|uniref:Uncharacterized protein n=1 Tax=Artomyces pyxidatus TaxID=48021 RepID=A0ACB8SP53_9AGAM|nr:hypothetical protein BV25DRAFT_1284197 [Artomyces pyxidatus]
MAVDVRQNQSYSYQISSTPLRAGTRRRLAAQIGGYHSSELERGESLVGSWHSKLAPGAGADTPVTPGQRPSRTEHDHRVSFVKEECSEMFAPRRWRRLVL